MTEAAAAGGAALAWLGVTLLVVADGRRGLALGLVVTTAGLALTVGAAGQPPLGVAALAAGGLAAAALRLRDGGPGWGVLAAGSTPRLVAAVLVLIGAVVVSGSELSSPLGAARLAALAVAMLAAGRVLTVDRRWAALGAGSALALGLGALADTPGMFAGAAVAAALSAIRGAERAGAAG